MADIKLTATSRKDVGRGASRRLRQEGYVPGILYGAAKDTQAITLEHKQLVKAIENEDFYSQILELDLDGKSERVVVKDIHRHAFKPKIEHMDLLRIKAGETITMKLPLHFINEENAAGVKQNSGIVSHTLSEVEIRCLPKDLPKFIEVDLIDLQLDETIHLSDLKLSHGVEILELTHGEEHDQPVVSIHLAKIVEEPVEEEIAPTEEAEATQEEGSKE